MSRDKFRKLIENVVGEEYCWKEYVLKTDGIQVIHKLSSRASDLVKIDFDKIGTLPRIAILQVIREIKAMTTSETTGEIGGFYIAFVKGLIEEIQDSRADSGEYFREEISRLQQIIQEDQVESLEKTKDEVCAIYRKFMMHQTSYADAEYEGSSLANDLGIHIDVNSISTGGNNYQVHYGPTASEDVPTITLNLTQGNRGAHFVLDKVNDELIPHSIYGDGNCLFTSIAQGILELYIQYSGDETNATFAQRRVSQIYKGVQLDLISRDKFVEVLQHSNDLLRQEMSEKLCTIDGDLLDYELSVLRDLIKYDVYQTVRIAASKVLYMKGTAQDRVVAQQTITELLTFPGLGMQHIDGYDLVRETAAEALLFLIENKKTEFIIDPTMLSVLRNSMMYDAFQTVRIASAKALYLIGNHRDCKDAEDLIIGLIDDSGSEGKESFGWKIVRTKAVEAIAELNNLSEIVLERVAYLRDNDTSFSVRRAALQTLRDLGHLENLPWTILIDKETEATYGSNGQVKLAIKFHPFSCVQDMALHKLLLDKKDHYEENFILLLQKFLANGTHEYPNKHSVAFLQALKYSINEFYQLPHCDNNEAFVARLFSLPGHTTPTLVLFDILLKDFISKTPQGKWSSHKHEMSHYKFMYSKHQEVKEAINDNIYRSVINTVMGSVIKNLYFLLGVFRDHTKIQAIEFFAEESAFMEVLKSAHPMKQSYQSLFNAEETDKFHVRSSLRDSERTSAMYVQMEFIRILHNLKAYMQNEQMTIKEFEQYIIKNTKAKEHPFQDPIEDFVIFLVELRERIYCGNGAQQMLGIGFEGSFFKAPMSNFFSNNPTIHLCFTEKFRIAGSVFLWHMIIQGLRDQLSTEFGQLIRILVDSSADPGLKLTYHYAMLKMWHEVIHNSTSVDDTLATKLRSLVNTELKAKMNQDPSNPKSKESLDHIEAYIIACGGTLETLKAINYKLNPPKSQKKSITNLMPLDIAEQEILAKFGDYIINEKILVCVETQLIPILHSGLIFPVMLKSAVPPDPSTSFILDKFRVGNFEHEFQFSVAKPCDKFCQPASTAYDLISEIHSQFTGMRGFIGSSVPKRMFTTPIMEFSEEELRIIEYAIQHRESYIDERYEVYEECYQNAQGNHEPYLCDIIGYEDEDYDWW